MSLQKILDKVRKWVDGEDLLDQPGEAKPRSKWDEFLVSIAREVEQSMLCEMFTPPGGPTYIPREYTVFLSQDDDAEWQGEKRQGLERGLQFVLSERAGELAGDNQFQTRTLSVELSVDPALERGKFRVQHVWDSETQKTIVNPRKRAEPAKPSGDDTTIVRPRKQGEPLFSVDVTRRDAEPAAEPTTHPCFKPEMSIGRGSSQINVDLKLEGDLEVSRKHATLTRDNGEYVITCHGANPLVLEDGTEISAGESAPIKPGQKVSICSYDIVVR